MNDECLLCGKPLEYLDESVEMECAICHKKELSNARCIGLRCPFFDKDKVTAK